jgi:phosphoglycolate phosphatase
MVSLKVKGVIFDMDNTLLKSRINFKAMKEELHNYLVEQKLLPHHLLSFDDHTCSTLIGLAMKEGVSQYQDSQIWSIVQKHEVQGMVGAGLEKGALELLNKLHGQYTLVILTNNAQVAAEKALKDTCIFSLFKLIVGRESMLELKPHPSGVEFILEMFPDILKDEWLFIGDSWIDGKAAQGAGVSFINYCGDIEEMEKKGVTPIVSICNLAEICELLGT